MFTPQQIQEISFDKAVFGGYDMASVDDVLEPLTEDYITLYKENSVLKSKMRILVEKLEEYRRQEASMQNAIIAAQKTCDQMLADAEKKCAKMLHDAEDTASAKAQNIDAMVGTEEERLQAAKEASAHFIDSMEKRIRRQLELLEELRKAELPDVKLAEKVPSYGKVISAPQEAKKAFDFDKAPSAPTTQEKADALIEEIGQRIEETMGPEQEAPVLTMPTPEELDAALDASAAEAPAEKPKKFEDLKFGRNYTLKRK